MSYKLKLINKLENMNSEKTYVERVVAKAKTAINANLQESIDSTEKLKTIRKNAEESAERQNHKLQGEIYKAKDAVKSCTENLENAKSAVSLNFDDIKQFAIKLKVAEADLKFLVELQDELFAKTEKDE